MRFQEGDQIIFPGPPFLPLLIMASASVGESQLKRIIRDLHDVVAELCKEHKECGEPITDDSPNLHKFSYKFEYLLQFDQKEKTTFLGNRKDYWDYFCDCLAKIKGANDGIRFVKSIPELKTSLGKGRAFIRYSLVHKRLADTLQQCLINQRVTCPFLKSHLTADIINHLYELNEIHFDVAARGHDLDSDWPTFARRTLGVNSPAYPWKAPSRCSSVNSLVSGYSQAQEFLPIPDFGQSLLGDLGELGEPSPCSVADDLRIELDQSELRQQELLERVRELGDETTELRGVVKDLEGQLLASQTTPPRREPITDPSRPSGVKANPETAKGEWVEDLGASGGAPQRELQARLTAAENKNMELLSKLDDTLNEKGHQTASYCDSAWKIQELLDKLKAAEEERLEARRDAEERSSYATKLAQELSVREEVLEKKLAELKAANQQEQDAMLRRAEDLQGAIGRIQGGLSLKEKESGNLRAQLQDLQASLEARERQAEELKRRLQEEREDMLLPRCSEGSAGQREALEDQLQALREQLKARETELAESSARIRQLEEHTEKLTQENQSYCNSGAGTEAMDQDTKQALHDQLATLRASEKHLKFRLDAAQLTVEERERRLLDENQTLVESVERALIQREASETKLKKLEQENKNLTEVEAAVKEELASAHVELASVTTKASEMEKNLQVSEKHQTDLQEKLGEAEARLHERTQKCELLQARAEELERRSGDLEREKGSAESSHSEKLSRDKNQDPAALSLEVQEASSRLVLSEAHLDLTQREVARLQAEVVGLRTALQAGSEEHMKTQALAEVTEASREDLRALAEQLKVQVEELNRRHVNELLRSREREEALGRERDGEAQARAGLAAEVTLTREELDALKRRYEALALENSEAREALHLANQETAELGVHVCQLTAENEEARLRWEGVSTRLEELEEAEAVKEADGLNATIVGLRQENQSLLAQLHQEDGLPSATEQLQERLAEGEARGLQETGAEEIQALRVQLSTQALDHQKQLLVMKEEFQEVRSQLEAEQDTVLNMETKVKHLESETQSYTQVIEEKNAQLAKSENDVSQKEEELSQLKGNLTRCGESLAGSEKSCQDLRDRLHRAITEKQNVDLRTSAELDDLYRTKINLEERLIQLIREKDALWQKSDALEFEQKLRDEETERDVNYCLGCHSQFSWWLRKHNCRLCGRPFCYYCCSNTVSTQQGGARERCCRDCYSQHSAVVERHPQQDVGSPPDPPFGPLPQPGRTASSTAEQGLAPDDGVFDIISEEEVNGVYDTDLSFSTPCSPGHRQQGAAELNSSTSAGDTTSEDAEDLSASVQDAEICLLRAGELTLCVPFSVDDITGFGDSSRELFVKSSCYSLIPIAVGNAGPTISWVFTSEPKSISFSVVYREDTEIPLDQAKVLIPLTRCSSHKETIQGELKVRNPGEYTLIFDNSFSRFISKKVLYRLSVEKPVVYDGSDSV
ncbi:FYVE and coiled-coil domain-containing protein 1 isoform X2 [Osmerus mordax]|uniref:FYVE and coiled-coil domain-containing protein 1 isoform X2 n=1 Tax=Osmerus mordax TaxID=8014 RepID=UPI003510A74E